jgi:hypothetical protein
MRRTPCPVLERLSAAVCVDVGWQDDPNSTEIVRPAQSKSSVVIFENGPQTPSSGRVYRFRHNWTGCVSCLEMLDPGGLRTTKAELWLAARPTYRAARLGAVLCGADSPRRAGQSPLALDFVNERF